VARKGTPRQAAGGSTPQIAAFALLGLAALTGLSLISLTRDPVTAGLLAVLRRLFGWGIYLIPLVVGMVGFWMLLQGMSSKPGLQWRSPLAATLLFVVSLTAAHLLSFPQDPRQLAMEGGGGGYVGWLLSQALVAAAGTIGAYVTIVASAAIGLLLLSGVSLSHWGAPLKRAGSAATERWKRLSLWLTGHRPRWTGLSVVPGWRPKISGWFRAFRGYGEGPQRNHHRPARPASPHREWQLPVVENVLENEVPREVSEAELRRKIRLIEETLSAFGVPGRVVEVNQGPTVTQFGVEPGYVERKERDGGLSRSKVKVSKIAALAKDLSLALAAQSVRIQAPVPGRSMIGVEVPNDQASLVPLRRIAESAAFENVTSALAIALGQDVSGGPVVADLARMPHLLIAGATGSGKSVCINSLVTCLLLRNTPKDLGLLMIDPKMVELVNFNGIPHLLAPVLVETERVVGTLRWVLREMDRRYRLFSAAAARNLAHYNELRAVYGGRPLPYIVVVIDELADLMMAAPDEVERSLCRLAQMSRATGIHLVVATQRPSVDVVTGLIKANFPARISFAVTSQADSRVILDQAGAEKLLGRGDMLYVAADASSPVRLQGCFVSDREIDRLVNFWRGLASPWPSKIQELVQQPLWSQMETVVENEREQEDELLERAVELVKGQRRASTTFLQRRLRIGYVRASRLMDRLEERGVVGPPPSAGGSRRILEMAEEIPWTAN
jgi:S-DNA-T family DNA segregation ATPase FtsK/SpoIIIE